MRVRCIRSVSLGGGVDIHPGDEVELEDIRANFLITIGSAIPASEAPAPPSSTGRGPAMRESAGEIQTPPEPEPENREPRKRKG